MYISPLQIPEILEQIFLHLLHQILWDTQEQKSLLSNSPRDTYLAILRVLSLWYNVGEPLLWKHIKWIDLKDPSIHQRFWNHWDRVRSFHLEYGNKIVTATSSENIRRGAPRNGPIRTEPEDRELSNAGQVTGPNGVLPVYVQSLIPVSVEGLSTTSRIARNTIAAEGKAAAGTSDTAPRILIYSALDDLARAFLRPSSIRPSYRPRPLILQEHFLDQSPPQSALYLDHLTLSPSTPWNLYRSQLTHLTLTGLFVAILPLVPGLTFLDISLRCFAWRDELHMDKLLRTRDSAFDITRHRICPKLAASACTMRMSANSTITGSNHEHDEMVTIAIPLVKCMAALPGTAILILESTITSMSPLLNTSQAARQRKTLGR
jgi:hypothetical protein